MPSGMDRQIRSQWCRHGHGPQFVMTTMFSCCPCQTNNEGSVLGSCCKQPVSTYVRAHAVLQLQKQRWWVLAQWDCCCAGCKL